MPPLVKVYLNVIGDIGQSLPDPLTVFGILPDSAYQIGESRRGENPSPRDAWFFLEAHAVAEGEDFATAAHACLMRLLLRLKALDAGSRLARWDLSGKASITVHGFCPSLRDANLCYGTEAIRLIADLGTPLEEDFYEYSE